MDSVKHGRMHWEAVPLVVLGLLVVLPILIVLAAVEVVVSLMAPKFWARHFSP